MPDSVVARVADRLEIQPEQTDRVLRTLAQLIKKQSARDGRVHVPGLGVFQQSSGALVFEPDEALAEAVNLRYAGLETVPLTRSPEAEIEEDAAPPEDVAEDLEEETAADAAVEKPAAEEDKEEVSFFDKGPFAEEEPAAEEKKEAFFFDEGPLAEEEPAAAEEKKETFFFDEETVAEEEFAEEEAQEKASFFKEEPAAEKEFAEEEEEKPAEEDASVEPEPLPLYAPESANFNDPDVSEAAAYGKLQEAADEIAHETHPDLAPPGSTWSMDNLETLIQETTEQEATAEETAFSEIDALTEEAEEEIEEEAQAALADDGEDRPPPLRPKREPRRRSAMPWILLVGAVLGIGAGLLYQFGFFGSSSTDPTLPPVAVETPPAETPTATTTPIDETPTETPAETPAVTPAQETPAQPTQVSGQGIDLNAGGYTLVVASLTQSGAEAEAERYRQLFSGQSIPVGVIQQESGGRIRYRVAIGQANTIEEAKALLSRLASDLPKGTWIRSITPDR